MRRRRPPFDLPTALLVLPVRRRAAPPVERHRALGVRAASLDHARARLEARARFETSEQVKLGERGAAEPPQMEDGVREQRIVPSWRRMHLHEGNVLLGEIELASSWRGQSCYTCQS